MTIEEAIAHCYEVAEGKTEQGKCESCAHEHAQLAMWLEELVAYRKLISQKNAPLTLDELRQMEGEPVWVERRDSAPILRWAIVGDFKSLYGVYFGTALGGLRLPYEEYGKTWLAYRRRPEEV